MRNPARLLAGERGGLADRFRIRIGLGLLALYGLAVLVVVLFPTPVDRPFRGELEEVIRTLHAHGLPAFIGYWQIEFSANVLMFAPIGFALALLVPRVRWWYAALAGIALSAIIEAAQWLILPARTGSVGDIVSNGTGALLGAATALLFRLAVEHRDCLVQEDRQTGLRPE
jgi:hypothetical protein